MFDHSKNHKGQLLKELFTKILQVQKLFPNNPKIRIRRHRFSLFWNENLHRHSLDMGDFESKVGRCQHDVFIGTKANFLLKNSKKKATLHDKYRKKISLLESCASSYLSFYILENLRKLLVQFIWYLNRINAYILHLHFTFYFFQLNLVLHFLI